MSSLEMGAAAGIVCFYACTTLKSKYKYDDALDAFGVHGIGGTLGAVLTGVFASRAVADPILVSQGNPVGMIDGNNNLILGQLAATVVTWVFAAVVTLILLKMIDATIGLRVSQDDEVRGLDLSQHGEEGYIQV
jgi:Amt family ammonium transporter